MVSIKVSKLGKTSVAFIEKGAKINQEYYYSHVIATLIPEMDNLAATIIFLCKKVQNLIPQNQRLNTWIAVYYVHETGFIAPK